jgi:hypothetical protein
MAPTVLSIDRSRTILVVNESGSGTVDRFPVEGYSELPIRGDSAFDHHGMGQEVDRWLHLMLMDFDTHGR